MTKRLHHRQWLIRSVVTAAVVGVVGVGIVLAEDVWVNRPFVEIREGKGSLYPVVVKVDQGTKLTVIDHESPWMKVQVNGQEGYVLESAMSAREVGGEAFTGVHDSNSSGMSAANAGKSFEPHDYAVKMNYSEAPLNNLIKEMAPPTVTAQGLDMFMAVGKIGPYKRK